MLAIGIDLGGTNIKSALVDDDEGILDRFTLKTEASKGLDHVLSRLSQAIKKTADAADEPPIGVGMGSPGMISLDRTTVQNPPNLPGWEHVNIAEEIFERTGYRCLVENDANLAALGSHHFGEGRKFNDFIMITLGTGVGGGIIYDGKLFRGTTGAAAELGHIIINYHGPLSNSNTRGGIEAYLGQRFLSRYAADRIRQDHRNPLYKKFSHDFEELEPIDLYNAAEDGNQLAQEVLYSAGEKLGYAIVNYIHVLDIRKVIVSGGVAQAGHWILDPARKTALNYMMATFHDGFELIFEKLCNKAALLGAASLAFREIETSYQS